MTGSSRSSRCSPRAFPVCDASAAAGFGAASASSFTAGAGAGARFLVDQAAEAIAEGLHVAHDLVEPGLRPAGLLLHGIETLGDRLHPLGHVAHAVLHPVVLAPQPALVTVEPEDDQERQREQADGENEEGAGDGGQFGVVQGQQIGRDTDGGEREHGKADDHRYALA